MPYTPVSKTEAQAVIADLTDRFQSQLESYKKSDYNETQTRRDFIDPFFKALGWDMNNEQGFAEAYREVIHEDKVKTKQGTKAPDYAFRLGGGKRLFYVEAKKPSIAIKEDILPAYQVRRYGWSAKLAVSIVTDFEEFAVYDCTKKPKETDKASVARIKYLTYKDYLTEFDYLWDTFSKEGVLKGGLDKYVKNDALKKGTATVDTEFLVSLNEWRKQIAEDVAKNNKDLGEDEINFAVQQTIDRIVFLRIAEGRNVEPYANLKNELGKKEHYQNLLLLFHTANQKYNSGLFDFKKDLITPHLKVSDKVIKNIIHSLYYPESPYEFSVLSVEILGSAYEQFLGKQITLDAKRKVIIDDRPEVRKAGGVYYTPQYIVEYIVDNTIGKLFEGKTPEQVSKIKILDPACGSGSFLIGAYDYLLRWHKEYYEKNPPKKNAKNIPFTPNGQLTSVEKKRILLNNIFGTDIDLNAVEVTKLSLLLKCMEGETEASIQNQLSIFNERVLPTLDDNIKSGNSLIDTDFYANQLDFEPHIEKKIKPFDWKKAFPQVFNNGGFDVVIGNPPYVKIQTLQESNPAITFDYYKQKYQAAVSGNYDLYVLFTEKGFELLNSNGVLGYILPHKFFQSEFGEGVRNYLAKQKAIHQVVHFGAEQIFTGATTYTCLLFLNKKTQSDFEFIRVTNPLDWAFDKSRQNAFTSKQPVIGEKWNFSGDDSRKLIDKINSIPETLGDITRKIFVGLQTSADKIYVLELLQWKDQTVRCFSKSLKREIEIETGIVKPFLMGKDVKRYKKPNPRNVVIFPYVINEGKANLMNHAFIQEQYPLAWQYLIENKAELEAREKGKFCETWWQFGRTQNLTEFDTVKIMTPYLGNGCNFTIDKEKLYHTTKVFSIAFNMTLRNEVLYILGLLNSELMNFHIKTNGTIFRGGYVTFNTQYIETFRIKQVDLNSKTEKKLHDEVISLVERLLQMNEEIQDAVLSSDSERLQSKIDYCENRINQIVYQLYGLDASDIALIER